MAILICDDCLLPFHLKRNFNVPHPSFIEEQSTQKPKHKERYIMNDRTNDIIISGDNLELTEALKSIVLEKVSKLFEHEQHIIRMRIELSAVQDAHREKEFSAKGHIEIKGKPLIVTESSIDLYKSIDLVVEKLDRMLRRRSRLRVLKRKQPHQVDIPAEIPKTQMA